jgi:hypothetical protein
MNELIADPARRESSPPCTPVLMPFLGDGCTPLCARNGRFEPGTFSLGVLPDLQRMKLSSFFIVSHRRCRRPSMHETRPGPARKVHPSTIETRAQRALFPVRVTRSAACRQLKATSPYSRPPLRAVQYPCNLCYRVLGIFLFKINVQSRIPTHSNFCVPSKTLKKSCEARPAAQISATATKPP